MNKKAVVLAMNTLIKLVLAAVVIFFLLSGIYGFIFSALTFGSTKEKQESAERNFEALVDLIKNLEEDQQVPEFPIYLYANKHTIVGFQNGERLIYGKCDEPGSPQDIEYLAFKPAECGDGGCLCICNPGSDVENKGKEFRILCRAEEGGPPMCANENDFGREISFIGGFACPIPAILPKPKGIHTIFVEREDKQYVRLCLEDCGDDQIDLLSWDITTLPDEMAELTKESINELVVVAQELPNIELQAAPSLYAAEVYDLLDLASSPLMNYSEEFLDYSYEYGIDNALALAFFDIETDLARSSIFLKGSTECTPEETFNPGKVPFGDSCNAFNGQNCDGICQYSGWKEGIEGWHSYIKQTFIDKGITNAEAVVDAQCKYPICDPATYFSEFSQAYNAYKATESNNTAQNI